MVSAKYISLDDVIEGMILSDDLLDSRNNILLPKLTVLTASMIASLQRQQIKEIAIEGAEDGDDEQSNSLNLEEKLKRLDRLFGAVENEMINAKFKQIIVNFYRAEKS